MLQLTTTTHVLEALPGSRGAQVLDVWDAYDAAWKQLDAAATAIESGSCGPDGFLDWLWETEAEEQAEAQCLRVGEMMREFLFTGAVARTDELWEALADGTRPLEGMTGPTDAELLEAERLTRAMLVMAGAGREFVSFVGEVNPTAIASDVAADLAEDVAEGALELGRDLRGALPAIGAGFGVALALLAVIAVK